MIWTQVFTTIYRPYLTVSFSNIDERFGTIFPLPNGKTVWKFEIWNFGHVAVCATPSSLHIPNLVFVSVVVFPTFWWTSGAHYAGFRYNQFNLYKLFSGAPVYMSTLLCLRDLWIAMRWRDHTFCIWRTREEYPCIKKVPTELEKLLWSQRYVGLAAIKMTLISSSTFSRKWCLWTPCTIVFSKKL